MALVDHDKSIALLDESEYDETRKCLIFFAVNNVRRKIMKHKKDVPEGFFEITTLQEKEKDLEERVYF